MLCPAICIVSLHSPLPSPESSQHPICAKQWAAANSICDRTVPPLFITHSRVHYYVNPSQEILIIDLDLLMCSLTNIRPLNACHHYSFMSLLLRRAEVVRQTNRQTFSISLQIIIIATIKIIIFWCFDMHTCTLIKALMNNLYITLYWFHVTWTPCAYQGLPHCIMMM